MWWFREKSSRRKDSMQRHVMSKHRNAGLAPFQTVLISSKKWPQFRREHPFTCTIAGMTASGKTARVRSLLQQASGAIYLPPKRSVWCYQRDEDSGLHQTADVNLYHMTTFSPYFPFTLYCFYTKTSSFMPVFTLGIVRDCFYLLIFYFEKFST